jgi:hypothetical protein
LRVSILNSFTKSVSVFSLLLLFCVVAFADVSTDEAAKMLPDKLGDFHALGAPRPMVTQSGEKPDFSQASSAWREYASTDRKAFRVAIIKARSDSAAYAFLSDAIQQMQKTQPSRVTKLDGIGTTAFAAPKRLAFFKGSTFVVIDTSEGEQDNREKMIGFANSLAQTLDNGEGDIPALVKHLPDWEQAQERATYAISLSSLLEASGHQSVLEVINFEGGTEAVVAPYGQAQLVIVEHTTPQIAADSDARIKERINQLREGGQPTPSGYRRVGNYSVFVFDAPDEQTATQLIGNVHYEQLVQWLGDNPRIIERMNRDYRQTTAGLILAVLKASGLSLLLCLGVGGIFGGIVFKRRRSRQGLTEAYSDAGGMTRLNLDEMTAQADPSRLLSRGEG